MLSLDSSLGGSHKDFILKLQFGESIKFFFQSNLLERLWLDTLLRYIKDCRDRVAL